MFGLLQFQFIFQLLELINDHLKDFEPWQIVLGTTCFIQLLNFLIPALKNVFGKNFILSFSVKYYINYVIQIHILSMHNNKLKSILGNHL